MMQGLKFLNLQALFILVEIILLVCDIEFMSAGWWLTAIASLLICGSVVNLVIGYKRLPKRFYNNSLLNLLYVVIFCFYCAIGKDRKTMIHNGNIA